ncbi:MAG: glutamate--tRNA ligase [Alphaproteobacteria bacterium]|nr:glutamate--tRNA ligase [Alphaproteobacteria bacterium]
MKARFAPSPTGLLHVGNARVALINWLHARHGGGEFVLRIDDTDRARSRPEFEAAIEADLAWLGLDWDARYRQSERVALYAAAFERLSKAGRLYACYESQEELELKRRSQLARGEPPRYDRAALGLTEADHARLAGAGQVPHWRFRLADGATEWTDLVRGAVRFEAAHLSDPILFRVGREAVYQLASVVDDLDLGITHVIRGEDHVANTPIHIQIALALGGEPDSIRFAHLPLLTDTGGAKLSKRLGGLALGDLKADGIEAMAVNSLLARLGSADRVVAVGDLEALAAGFDLGHFGRAPPKFDTAELARLNAELLHRLSFERAAGRLRALGLGAVDPVMWLALRGNLVRLADIADWLPVCRGTIEPVIEDPAFAAEAAQLLPPEPWDTATWQGWTDAVKAATGRAGRALFHPLRLALTGRERGPELRNLLPIIGHARALARLRGDRA